MTSRLFVYGTFLDGDYYYHNIIIVSMGVSAIDDKHLVLNTTHNRVRKEGWWG